MNQKSKKPSFEPWALWMLEGGVQKYFMERVDLAISKKPTQQPEIPSGSEQLAEMIYFHILAPLGW